MLVKIKGIHIVKRKLANGTMRHHYYAWRGGPKMCSKPHTEAFAAEHARLKAAATPKIVDTLETLIQNFTGPDKLNADWLALAESTRRDHEYAFKMIRKEWPSLPVQLTQQKGMKADIRKWHRSFSANPRKADKLLFSLSKVFSYAVADEIIDKNPCHGVERLWNGTRREEIWSQDQIAALRTTASDAVLLAFEMAIATGQRQGDLLSRTWRDYDGTYLRFEQSKSRKKTASGKRLKVRVSNRLKVLLDAGEKDTFRILVNSRKRPWTPDGFRTSWQKACRKAGIRETGEGGVTFHDLRGTFISERFNDGESVENIALISGHSIGEVKSILEKHYLSPDQGRADAVILRMEKHQKRTKSVNRV